VITIRTDKTDQQSGVSRVNKELANLIARNDPVLSRITKKQKHGISKQKKSRMEAQMIKAAAKAVNARVWMKFLMTGPTS
jgi:DNA-binding ferritin-like protein